MLENSKVEELRDILMSENQQFRELAQQHQYLEDRLSELANLTYPSDEEQLEEHDIKKKKLAVKDEMYEIMNSYQSAH